MASTHADDMSKYIRFIDMFWEYVEVIDTSRGYVGYGRFFRHVATRVDIGVFVLL
jgi:hypothetical protein